MAVTAVSNMNPHCYRKSVLKLVLAEVQYCPPQHAEALSDLK